MYPFHLTIRTPVPIFNTLPLLLHHSFVTSFTAYHCSILYESPDRLISQVASIEPNRTACHGPCHTRSLFFSMARLTIMAAALLLPILVQAVAFSVDSFEDIAVGKPVDLTWWGDKNVRFILFHPTCGLTRVTLSASHHKANARTTGCTRASGKHCM